MGEYQERPKQSSSNNDSIGFIQAIELERYGGGYPKYSEPSARITPERLKELEEFDDKLFKRFCSPEFYNELKKQEAEIEQFYLSLENDELLNATEVSQNEQDSAMPEYRERNNRRSNRLDERLIDKPSEYQGEGVYTGFSNLPLDVQSRRDDRIFARFRDDDDFHRERADAQRQELASLEKEEELDQVPVEKQDIAISDERDKDLSKDKTDTATISVEKRDPAISDKKDVANLTQSEKLLEALTLTIQKLPSALGSQLKALINPASIAVMVGVLGAYTASHAVGVGFIADAVMGVSAGLFLGWQAVDVAKDLWAFAQYVNATTEEDLDKAAEHLAKAIMTVGFDVILGILTKKAAGKVSQHIDELKQVDEVHAHHDPNANAANLDDANRATDVDNASQISNADNAAITPAQQLINAGYNPAVVDALLPVLGREGVERLHKMDMFSFAPERITLLDSGQGQAVRNLPSLRNKPKVEIETILDNAGFARPTAIERGQEIWLHPDGSVVRMKVEPEAFTDKRPAEHLVREVSRKQPASSKQRDVFAKVAEDGTLIPAGPKFAEDQLQQWFRKETGRLPNEQELEVLMDIWADAAHIDFLP